MEFFTKEASVYKDGDEDWIDAEISEDILLERLAKIEKHNFWEYIKKWIYSVNSELADENSEFNLIPDEKYRKVASKSFNNNEMKAQWDSIRHSLGRDSTERKTVIYYMFGLNMSVDDAELLLKKGLGQRGFNVRSPYEVIVYFCLKNNMKFSKVDEYLTRYVDECLNTNSIINDNQERDTQVFKDEFSKICSEEELFEYLSRLTDGNRKRGVLTGEKYSKADVINETYYNEHILQTYTRLLETYKQHLNKAMVREEVMVGNRVEEKVGRDTTNNVLNNMVGNVDSNLLKQCLDGGYLDTWADFSYELTNDRISGRIKGDYYVTREDIVTLCFLNYVMVLEADDSIDNLSKTEIYDGFTESVNITLESLGMQPIYLPNPFDMFIAICLYSFSPLETFFNTLDLAQSKSPK